MLIMGQERDESILVMFQITEAYGNLFILSVVLENVSHQCSSLSARGMKQTYAEKRVNNDR